jgi:hypothetical protein
VFIIGVLYVTYIIVRTIITIFISYAIFTSLFYIFLKKNKIISISYWNFINPWPKYHREKKQLKLMNKILKEFWLYLQTDERYLKYRNKFKDQTEEEKKKLVIMSLHQYEEWGQVEDNFFANFVEENIKSKYPKIKDEFLEHFTNSFFEFPILTLQKTEELILENKNKKLLILIPGIRAFLKKKELKEIFKYEDRKETQ